MSDLLVVHLEGRSPYLFKIICSASGYRKVMYQIHILMPQFTKEKGSFFPSFYLFWATFFTICNYFLPATLKCNEDVYRQRKENIFSSSPCNVIADKKKIKKHSKELTGITWQPGPSRQSLTFVVITRLNRGHQVSILNSEQAILMMMVWYGKTF